MEAKKDKTEEGDAGLKEYEGWVEEGRGGGRREVWSKRIRIRSRVTQ